MKLEGLKQLKIDGDSRMPKYRQVVNSIMEEIEKGNLKVGQRIPSINEISEEYYLSRDTVEKAYNRLKELKIIVSAKGKGYYVNRTVESSKINILFMMNKLSSYKLQIYNAFVNRLGTEATIDLQLYHCDPRLFKSIMEEKKGAFDYYVVMPHFIDEAGLHKSMTREVYETLKDFPEGRLVLLDNYIPELRQASSIYQDFKMDIYEALQEGVELLRKYQKLILVFPRKAVYPFPMRIQQGFQKFCTDNDFAFEVLDEIDEHMDLESRDAFIIIEEQDLVSLVKQVRDKKYTLGTDIGVVSYNDTPLKDLLGITVISTDFGAMGETAAYMIQSRKHEVVKNSFRFINRNSV